MFLAYKLSWRCVTCGYLALTEMEKKILGDKLKLKELELNAVLEITNAINDNIPEEALYKIYDHNVDLIFLCGIDL